MDVIHTPFLCVPSPPAGNQTPITSILQLTQKVYFPLHISDLFLQNSSSTQFTLLAQRPKGVQTFALVGKRSVHDAEMDGSVSDSDATISHQQVNLMKPESVEDTHCSSVSASRSAKTQTIAENSYTSSPAISHVYTEGDVDINVQCVCVCVVTHYSHRLLVC